MATMGGRSNQTLLHQRSLSSFHHLRKKILGGKLEQTFVVGGSFLHSLQTAWGKKKIELIGFRGWIFFYRWGDEWLKRSPCCTLGGPMGFKDLYTLLLLLTTLGILNSSPRTKSKAHNPLNKVWPGWGKWSYENPAAEISCQSAPLQETWGRKGGVRWTYTARWSLGESWASKLRPAEKWSSCPEAMGPGQRRIMAADQLGPVLRWQSEHEHPRLLFYLLWNVLGQHRLMTPYRPKRACLASHAQPINI